MTETGYCRVLLDIKDAKLMKLESEITKLRIEYEKQIDESMEKRVKTVSCECGGSFTQVRKGSFIGKCNACGKRVILGKRAKR